MVNNTANPTVNWFIPFYSFWCQCENYHLTVRKYERVPKGILSIKSDMVFWIIYAVIMAIYGRIKFKKCINTAVKIKKLHFD